MSQTSTYNLVAGKPTNIISPTSVSSWANAVIINLTTGTVYLNIGGNPSTLPQLQSIQVKNPGMTANLTATATVSGTLEVIWYFQGEVVPTTVPVTATDITVNGPVDITGPVSVYTSGADLVSTQSKAAAFSETLTPAAGGGTATATVTIPTSPVMHAALVSGVYTITAASNQPIQIQVVGNNTNTLYYNFDNLTTNVTNQAIPEAVIAISAADTALVVSHVSGGGTQSSVINLNFYSQAIPPDPYVASLITQGLFGTTAETVINPLVSPPLLQSVYNTQISTNWGIKVADALAPADSSYTNFPSITAATWTTIFTPSSTADTILQHLDWTSTSSNAGRTTFRVGTSGTGFTSSYGAGTGRTSWDGRLFIPQGSVIQIYSDDALTYVFSADWATL
jgi:hypothetical protein